jgi:hypothetical protein
MSDPTYNLNGGFKPTVKRFADLSGPDFFRTPPWATFALIDNEPFEGEIWESACGDGSMSRVLEQTGQPVRSTDLYDRGYGEAGIDFLAPLWSSDNIVTNPPYHCAEGFVASGVKHARRKFALLAARLPGGRKSRQHHLYPISSVEGLGVQRTHYVLSERCYAKGQWNDCLCVVCLGQGSAGWHRIKVVQARLQGALRLGA